MKRVVFLTPVDAWPGFELAGMEQIVTDGEGISALLMEKLTDLSTGVVVLDERLHAHVPEELLTRLDREHPGRITILPSPLPADSNLALQIIRQAIGYHVRFRG